MGEKIIKPEPPKGRIFANYAVSRKQKREVAKNRMKADGKVQFCKHDHKIMEINHAKQDIIVPSFFAKHWREYAIKED